MTTKICELINAGMKARELNQVLDTLRAYDEVNVTRENGEFEVSASVSISARKKADDFKVWFITCDEVYTREERFENYANVFLDRPRGYDGKWDYAFVNAHADDIRKGYYRAKFVNGEIIWK